MAEHLFCKQVVAGSTPVAGSILSASALSCQPLISLPDGVMVAQQILTLLVKVRVLIGQPSP